MKRLAACLWILGAAAAVAALPRDQPVLVNCLAVTPLPPLAAVVGGGPAFTQFARTVPIPEGVDVVGALTPVSPSMVSVRYTAVGGDARVEDAGAVGALVSCVTALTMGGVPVFGRVGLADPTGGGAPTFRPLRESLGVADVRLSYAQFLGVTALAVDPLVVPFDLWSAGPLGELRTQANAAAARGDKAAFQELAGRYWALFNAAVERRRVLGGGAPESGRK